MPFTVGQRKAPRFPRLASSETVFVAVYAGNHRLPSPNHSRQPIYGETPSFASPIAGDRELLQSHPNMPLACTGRKCVRIAGWLPLRLAEAGFAGADYRLHWIRRRAMPGPKTASRLLRSLAGPVNPALSSIIFSADHT